MVVLVGPVLVAFDLHSIGGLGSEPCGVGLGPVRMSAPTAEADGSSHLDVLRCRVRRNDSSCRSIEALRFRRWLGLLSKVE